MKKNFFLKKFRRKIWKKMLFLWEISLSKIIKRTVRAAAFVARAEPKRVLPPEQSLGTALAVAATHAALVSTSQGRDHVITADRLKFFGVCRFYGNFFSFGLFLFSTFYRCF
jgi:hypothetical protein